MSVFSQFFADAVPVTAGTGAVAPESPAKIIFEIGEIAVTEKALLHAGIVIGVVFVLSLALKRIFAAISRRVTRAKPLVGSAFSAVSHGTHLLLFAFTVRALVPYSDRKLRPFDIDFGDWGGGADRAAKVLLIIAFTVAILHLVRVPVAWFRAFSARTESKLDDMLVPVIDTTLRVFVIIGGIIQVIASLSGSTPAQIVAPLAVGGLAIGLAAQDTVKNVFGSVMLIIDEPFRLGDFVNIGSHSGTVEALGLRSTRLRTPEGHLVTVPNGDLANRAIQNISMRRHIRQLLTIGLTYDTPAEKIEEALAILKELLAEHEGFDPAFPPRVHLEKLADWSLNIQIIYWYHPGDHWACMSFNQKLYLDILRRFESAGINIAFPTQTVINRGLPPAAAAISPAK